jgi:DNA replication and repair protein RecF
VFISTLRLVHFRSYCDDTIHFHPGLNVIVGENASGKTNLLEAAYFSLRGASPRTRREDKLLTWGERFTRVTVTVDGGLGEDPAPAHSVEVAYAPGQGKRLRLDGVALASGDELRRRFPVFTFVPESLLLVKGSPARRRAHIDAFAAALDAGYGAALRDLNEALRQRNAQLVAVRAGASPDALDPWDVQLAHCAIDLGVRRRAVVEALAGRFAAVAAALAPAGAAFAVRLVSRLAEIDYDEVACLDALRLRRGREIQRGLSTYGPQRDDLLFLETAADEPGAATVESPPIPVSDAGVCATGPPAAGRDLRLFGSQGEQRAAVLALLLAEQALARETTGDLGPLFLDDVMSELDDARRRRLAAILASAGQTMITTTNLHYFTEDELRGAHVIELPLNAAPAR